MTEIFETVLTLSLFGFGITALLLIIKPVTAKKFPAKWQYYVWVAVLVSMTVPIYKFIPKEEAQKLSFVAKTEAVQHTDISQPESAPAETAETPLESTAAPAVRENIQKRLLDMMDIFSYIWLLGMCVYILAVIISYAVYLLHKRKNSFLLTDNHILESVKAELGIKRYIELKTAEDIGSPMLVGVIFPTIYIPSKDINDENMRMIFLHELTHYKRKDLIIKWFSLFVNAVHWFNPLAYLLCASLSEACEVSCDMAVTKNMSDAEQKTYMKTILDLAV